MTPQERRIAVSRLDSLIEDLQRAAMSNNAERDLIIVLIYKVALMAEILKQMLQDSELPKPPKR
jgi:hypothetical protein